MSQPHIGRHQAYRSEATRYLCAAGHLDENFRRLAIQELLFHPHRAVSPSYGIDVVPVLRHCLLANRRMLIRDLALTAFWIVTLIIAPTLAWTCLIVGLFAWYATTFVSQRVAGLAGIAPGLRQGGCIIAGLLLLGPLVFGLIITVYIVVFFVSSRASQLASALELATLGLYGPRALLADFAAFAIAAIFPLLVVATLFVYRLAVHNQVIDALQPQPFARYRDPVAPAWAEPRLQLLAEAQFGNVTYVAESRAADPFVGSGWPTERVSFAVPLVRRAGADPHRGDAEACDRAEVTAEALYERLRSTLVMLGHPQTPRERRLSGLAIQDRLYVNGRLAPGSHYLTPPPSQPRPWVEGDVLAHVTGSERGNARRYLVVRVATWGGEVETSVFFYVAVRGDMLYVENVATMLPPIAERYHAIDSYERLTASVAVREFLQSLLDLVRVAPAAPLRLLWLAQQHVQRRRRQAGVARELRRRLTFDYGSKLSLRELGSSREDVWFAGADADEIQKLIMRRALGTIAETLDEYGYDTAEFDTRANVVINNSTTNLSGATITNSSIASGPASKATSRVSPAAKG